MKYFISCFMVLAFLVTTNVWSQQETSSADTDNWLKTNFNLSEDQLTAISALRKSHNAKAEELKKNLDQKGSDKSAIESQMKQLNQDMFKQINAILSKEQLDKITHAAAEIQLPSVPEKQPSDPSSK